MRSYFLAISIAVVFVVVLLWPSSAEDDSDILLAVLMTKSYSIPSNIPWKNYIVCDIRDRNSCLQSARFKYPRHSLMVDLDNYKIEKTRPIRGQLDANTIYNVPVYSGLHMQYTPLLLPQTALDHCKYEGKVLQCDTAIPQGISVAFSVVDYMHPEQELDLYDKNKHFVHLGRVNELLNKTDVALSYYEKVVQQHNATATKCNAETFYALYRIAVIKLLHKGEAGNFLSAQRCNPFRKEPLYYMARMARSALDYSSCFMYTTAGLFVDREDETWDHLYVEHNIYRWAMREQHAECLFLLGKRKEAHEHFKELLEKSSHLLSEETRKRIEHNFRQN